MEELLSSVEVSSLSVLVVSLLVTELSSGEEVSSDVINSEYFVGYDFKKCLLEVQQAIMIYCMK